ncbi:MAG: PH domain-containing protein [Rikenellaceae bacterium]|nr:PH domain-containing protein [Rikenellaceae bacterium]
MEVKIITVLALCIMIWCSAMIYIYTPNMPIILRVLPIGIIFCIIVTAFTQMPVKLSVREQSIVIGKIMGNVIIPVESILSVERVEPQFHSKSIQIFGSGGFLGYTGKFKNFTEGRYTVYATRKKNLILVKTRNKKYLFNCDRSYEFLDILTNLNPLL